MNQCARLPLVLLLLLLLKASFVSGTANPAIRLRKRLHIFGRSTYYSFSEECTATGSPLPNITWYHNGSALKHGDAHGSIDLEEAVKDKPIPAVVSTLWVVGVEKRHVGNYTCEAVNTMGRSSDTMRVFLAEKPAIVSGERRIVRENENLTLACHIQNLIRGDPKETLLWEFEGKPISRKSPRHKQSSTRVSGNAVRMELTVLNASTTDSGRFDCNAGNSAEPERNSTGNVSLVVVKKDLKPTLNLPGPRERQVRLGYNVSLRCDVTYPAYMTSVNMTWSNSSGPAGHQVTENHVEELTTRSFLLWLELRRVALQDLGLYTCHMDTPTGELAERVRLVLPVVTTAGGSDGNTVMLALIVTAGLTLGVLSGLGLVHLWRRRTHARDGKGPLLEEQFCYDVFVTFSSKDLSWVKATLIPVLEKENMNYCIHNRDFELGKGILDNMADSVYRSKKVLAVMSRHYMDSKYCRGELEMALYRSTETGDSSLIVIRIDDIEKKRLPKALRNRTFLDYYEEKERKTWEERLVKHLAKCQANIEMADV